MTEGERHHPQPSSTASSITPFSPFGTAPPGSPATIPGLVVAAVWGPWLALGLAWAEVMQAAIKNAKGPK